MRNINVFVYGTLLSGASRPASAFVGADVLSTAYVPGAIYDLGWFPGFKTVSAIEHGDYLPEVKGELILVDEEGLERLDAYEGCPDLYSRQDITVKTEGGFFVPAFIYVYNGNVHKDDLVPHGDWLAHEKENA